jgi:beta-phosphoglucomutase
MKLKAVCFDMDGVLVDTMPHHVAAWLNSFKEKGFNHNEIDFYIREGMPGRKTIEDIFNSCNVQVTEKDIEEIYIAKRKYFKKHAKYKFINETVQLLKELQKMDIPCCLVTGSRKEFVEEVLQSLPFHFHSVITGDDVDEGKPSPEPYNKAMQSFPLNPSQWLIIENAPLGIKSAKSSGAYCLAMETTLGSMYLKEADLIVKPSQLIKSVKSLLSE